MLYLTLYDDVFFVVLTLLLTFAAVKFRLRNIPNYHLVAFFEAFLILLVTLLASWFISTRPAEIEGDTSVYLDFYETVVNGTGHPFAIFEPGFAVITLFLSEMGLDLRVLFFVVPLLLSLSYHRLAVRVFGIRSSMTVMVFACILIYPFFLSLTANVIRQGLAMALVLLAISRLLGGQKWRPRLLALVSLVFHKSTVILLPWVFFRRTTAKLPVSLLLLVWILVSACSVFGIFKSLATLLFDQLAAMGVSINYGDTSAIDYQTGFRLSFWLFSSCSIFFLLCMKAVGFTDRRMMMLFKMSAYFGIVHILTFDVAYNDRFGLYVWMLYPIQAFYLARCVLVRLSRATTYNRAPVRLPYE